MTKNYVSKTWDGRIVDAHNNLHIVTAYNDYRTMQAGKTYVMERHDRIAPVEVTSTLWNAMQKACSIYNANR